MKHIPLQLLFAATLALASASAAQAFTFESQSGAGNTSQFNDLSDQITPKTKDDAHRFDSNQQGADRRDGFYFQFGGQRSFDERYNPNNLYDPLRR